MHFTRSLRIVAVLSLLVGFTPILYAQEEVNPDEAGGVLGDDVTDRLPIVNEQSINRPPIFVQVLQNPMRIAPGESGLLLLHVQAPPDGSSKIGAGGSANFEKDQGPIALGVARFDPPPAGSKTYKNLLVRIPITIDAKAKHGTYDVIGTLRLPGLFSAPRVEPGSAPDPSRAGADAAGSTDPNLVPWNGRILCGPPLPKAKRRKPPSTAKAATAPDEKATVSRADETAAPKAGPSGAPGRVAEITGRDEERSLDDGLLAPATDDGGGLPKSLFLVLAGAGAALLLAFFVLQGRGKTA